MKPAIYHDLSDWYDLIDPCHDHADEAAVYLEAFLRGIEGTSRTLLELGCGAGNNASFLKAVTRPSSGAVTDAQLVTEIRSFEVVTPGNEAVVQISAKLVSERNGRILAGRIFTRRVPVAAVDAPRAASGLDSALSGVMLDIVRWVSATPIPSRDVPPESAA